MAEVNHNLKMPEGQTAEAVHRSLATAHEILRCMHAVADAFLDDAGPSAPAFIASQHLCALACRHVDVAFKLVFPGDPGMGGFLEQYQWLGATGPFDRVS